MSMALGMATVAVALVATVGSAVVMAVVVSVGQAAVDMAVWHKYWQRVTAVGGRARAEGKALVLAKRVTG